MLEKSAAHKLMLMRELLPDEGQAMTSHCTKQVTIPISSALLLRQHIDQAIAELELAADADEKLEPARLGRQRRAKQRRQYPNRHRSCVVVERGRSGRDVAVRRGGPFSCARRTHNKGRAVGTRGALPVHFRHVVPPIKDLRAVKTRVASITTTRARRRMAGRPGHRGRAVAVVAPRGGAPRRGEPAAPRAPAPALLHVFRQNSASRTTGTRGSSPEKLPSPATARTSRTCRRRRPAPQRPQPQRRAARTRAGRARPWASRRARCARVAVPARGRRTRRARPARGAAPSCVLVELLLRRARALRGGAEVGGHGARHHAVRER